VNLMLAIAAGDYDEKAVVAWLQDHLGTLPAAES
jgi:hypothetical protein